MNLQIADMMGEFTNRLMYGVGEPTEAHLRDDEANRLVDELMTTGKVYGYDITLMKVMNELEGRGDAASLKMMKPETYEEGRQELYALLYDEAKDWLLDELID